MQFYGFDIPLSMRKTNLARLLSRRVDGIIVSDFEQGEIGPDLFRHACLMGLEQLVSKLKDRPYRPGRSAPWQELSDVLQHWSGAVTCPAC